jgi:hypothetical protein
LLNLGQLINELRPIFPHDPRVSRYARPVQGIATADEKVGSEALGEGHDRPMRRTRRRARIIMAIREYECGAIPKGDVNAVTMRSRRLDRWRCHA